MNFVAVKTRKQSELRSLHQPQRTLSRAFAVLNDAATLHPCWVAILLQTPAFQPSARRGHGVLPHVALAKLLWRNVCAERRKNEAVIYRGATPWLFGSAL